MIDDDMSLFMEMCVEIEQLSFGVTVVEEPTEENLVLVGTDIKDNYRIQVRKPPEESIATQNNRIAFSETDASIFSSIVIYNSYLCIM